MAGRFFAGFAVWGADAAEESGVRDRGGSYAGAGDWREHRDVRHCKRVAASAIAFGQATRAGERVANACGVAAAASLLQSVSRLPGLVVPEHQLSIARRHV